MRWTNPSQRIELSAQHTVTLFGAKLARPEGDVYVAIHVDRSRSGRACCTQQDRSGTCEEPARRARGTTQLEAARARIHYSARHHLPIRNELTASLRAALDFSKLSSQFTSSQRWIKLERH